MICIKKNVTFPARHSVCVFSILDLSTILKSGGQIVNKVMTVHDAAIGQSDMSDMTGLTYIYIAGECLRDSVRRRERDQ